MNKTSAENVGRGIRVDPLDRQAGQILFAGLPLVFTGRPVLMGAGAFLIVEALVEEPVRRLRDRANQSRRRG